MFQIKTRSLLSLAFAFLSVINSSAHAQPPMEQKNAADNEYLLKLDPFIVKAVKADPNDTPLRKFQKERCREGLISLAQSREKIKKGGWFSWSFSLFLDLMESLSRDLQEVMDTTEDKIKGYEFAVKAHQEFEEFIEARAKAGKDSTKHYNLAKAARIDVEIELLKLKAEVEKTKK